MIVANIAVGTSGVEMVVLAVLVLLCLGVGWRMFVQASGREKSDVSGLRLKHRADVPPVE